MASRQSKPANSTSTALAENGNGERERVFNAFRQWGYLEADLDPLGFLQPVPHPDLQIDGEYAEEARRIYCGTIGA
jgi:2-oxoglutarate dehydrogenase E1 component